MNSITFEEMYLLFCEAERETPPRHMSGAIVFTVDSFDKYYPLKSRTYLLSSNNKYFQPSKLGRSIFASCEDGSDPCIRLDWYMFSANDNWKIDYCYITDDGKGGNNDG